MTQQWLHAEKPLVNVYSDPRNAWYWRPFISFGLPQQRQHGPYGSRGQAVAAAENEGFRAIG